MVAGAFSWPCKVVEQLRLRPGRWSCSTAFTGIGCAEIGGRSLSAACRGLRLDFKHAVERNAGARAMLATHATSTTCTEDMFLLFPTCIDRSRLTTMTLDQLRVALLDDAGGIVHGRRPPDSFEIGHSTSRARLAWTSVPWARGAAAAVLPWSSS